MRLLALDVAMFLLLAFSADALRNQRGAFGDPALPSYPIVNVHVSEPTLNAEEFQLRSLAHEHEQDALLKLETRISAVEECILATLTALAEEAKDVSHTLHVNMHA